jgi:hypothetical protein
MTRRCSRRRELEDDDWSRIAPATGPEADNVRRADSAHPLDFFRGRDFSGRYLLSLTAELDDPALPDAPKLNGIEVTVERRPPANVRLVLTLQDRAQFDIFRALCDHLMKATRSEPPGANGPGLRLVLQRLRDWHEMLRRRREDLLSPQEVLGLAGELLFLRDQVLSRLSPPEGILSWRGAHREEQDFAFGGWQVEVKTQLSTSDQRLQIASEAQLDATSGRLLICHQCVATAAPDREGAFTLNSLVAGIKLELADAVDIARDAFDAALAAWGYVERSEYEESAWMLTLRRVYEVRSEFPRIVPAMLPPGVQNVSYQVRLSDCEPFAIDLDAAMAQAFV